MISFFLSLYGLFAIITYHESKKQFTVRRWTRFWISLNWWAGWGLYKYRWVQWWIQLGCKERFIVL